MVQFCLVQDFSCKVQVYFALTFFIQWIAIGLVKANFYEIRLAGGYKGAIMVAIIGLEKEIYNINEYYIKLNKSALKEMYHVGAD